MVGDLSAIESICIHGIVVELLGPEEDYPGYQVTIDDEPDPFGVPLVDYESAKAEYDDVVTMFREAIILPVAEVERCRIDDGIIWSFPDDDQPKFHLVHLSAIPEEKRLVYKLKYAR